MPSTLYRENSAEEIHDFLYNLFAHLPDPHPLSGSIRSALFGNRLPQLQLLFQIWKQVSHELGCRLWVNIESFQRDQIGTPNNFGPADFKRLAVQLAHAAQVGEKIVKLEVPYFDFSRR